MAEKSGCILNGVRSRYCVLFGSFPEASLEQSPVALVMAMTAALPGTPFALNDTTAAVASCGVSELPRTVPENVAEPGLADEEPAPPPPHDATKAPEAKMETRRMDSPERILSWGGPRAQPSRTAARRWSSGTRRRPTPGNRRVRVLCRTPSR